jgi:endoglucanase
MLLKKLTECAAVSGNEKAMRNLLKEIFDEKNISYEVDRMGNLIAHKEGNKEKRVLIYTHMDEPGMMIYDVDSAGLLKFMKVGGLNEEALMSKQAVVGDDLIKGVLGAKAIHLQEPSERKRVLKSSSLYIDIGAKDKEDAEKYVKKGQYASVCGPLRELENGFVSGKYLESRVGISLIMDLIEEKSDLDITFAFTTMHHVGNRGETVLIDNRDFDYSIGVCGAAAKDIEYADKQGTQIEVTKGSGLKLIDGQTVYPRKVYNSIVEYLDEKNISYQTLIEPRERGGFGSIQKRSKEIKGTEIFVPVRYAKTPSSVMSMKDYESALNILKTTLEGIEGGRI